MSYLGPKLLFLQNHLEQRLALRRPVHVEFYSTFPIILALDLQEFERLGQHLLQKLKQNQNLLCQIQTFLFFHRKFVSQKKGPFRPGGKLFWLKWNIDFGTISDKMPNFYGYIVPLRKVLRWNDSQLCLLLLSILKKLSILLSFESLGQIRRRRHFKNISLICEFHFEWFMNYVIYENSVHNLKDEDEMQ